MRGSKPGERRGGRKPGVPNKATAELRSLAREHGPAAISELSRLATSALSEQARISACTALLDRAYGKSQSEQPIDLALPDTSTLKRVSLAMGTIIEAVACGKLRPSEAQALCSVLKIQRESIEIMEIEQRLKSLENAVKDRKQ